MLIITFLTAAKQPVIFDIIIHTIRTILGV